MEYLKNIRLIQRKQKKKKTKQKTKKQNTRLKMNSLVAVSDIQRGSQSYVEEIRGRREIEVTRGRRGGIKRGERTFSSIQFSSVAQSCPTLCDPMNRSTPGLPVHHHPPEFTQTHVHRVSDAIQPSHPLLSLSPPAPNPSQHQSLFQ